MTRRLVQWCLALAYLMSLSAASTAAPQAAPAKEVTVTIASDNAIVLDAVLLAMPWDSLRRELTPYQESLFYLQDRNGEQLRLPGEDRGGAWFEGMSRPRSLLDKAGFFEPLPLQLVFSLPERLSATVEQKLQMHLAKCGFEANVRTVSPEAGEAVFLEQTELDTSYGPPPVAWFRPGRPSRRSY